MYNINCKLDERFLRAIFLPIYENEKNLKKTFYLIRATNEKTFDYVKDFKQAFIIESLSVCMYIWKYKKIHCEEDCLLK